MSYVHDDQYASLLGRGVRDRAVLLGRRCGVSGMSILGEYLQRVKAERDEAKQIMREALAWFDDSSSHDPDVFDRIRYFLSRYDLPEDYDEG